MRINKDYRIYSQMAKESWRLQETSRINYLPPSEWVGDRIFTEQPLQIARIMFDRLFPRRI